MLMENSHSETRLILSLSLQDIDNLAKDLKPRQRMFRFSHYSVMQQKPMARRQSAVSVTAFRRDR